MPLGTNDPEPESIEKPKKPIRSPPTLFRVEASAPLRKHMAILNKSNATPTIIRLEDLECIASLNTTLPAPAHVVVDSDVMPEHKNADALPREVSAVTTGEQTRPNINDQSDLCESRASSVSTVKSASVPEPEGVSQSSDVFVIYLDDDDDDEEEVVKHDGRSNPVPCAQEVVPASVLGKRKVRIGVDSVDQNLGATVSIAVTASLGSEQCPVELDSDSEREPSPKRTLTAASRAHSNAGSTAHEPIVISTEHTASDDELDPPPVPAQGAAQIQEESLIQVVVPSPPSREETSNATGSFQEQLRMYQRLQQEQYSRQRASGMITDSRVISRTPGTVTSRGASLNVTPQTLMRPSMKVLPHSSPVLVSPSQETKDPATLSVSDSGLPNEYLLEDYWPTNLESFFDESESSSSTTYSTSNSPQTVKSKPGNQPNRTKNGLVLSDDQLYVLDQVVSHRKNVFFTGSAGTGKSVLLRELIVRLKARHGRWEDSDDWDSVAAESVAVTASTGIAACNIGGCTLHSFAGIGLGQEPIQKLTNKVRNNRQSFLRWKNTGVLIVDEVSMIEAELLDKLEQLARTIRGNNKPWGGIQVVLCGDFFQLPPVDKTGKAKFCFEAESWPRSIHTTIQLERIFRQKDHLFADMLNQMRIGRMSSATIDKFKRLSRDIPQEDGIKPTELFPLRMQVQEANTTMLRKLTGQSMIFEAHDRGKLREKMEQHCIAPTKLEIKVNAQVMLLRNQGSTAGGLVNGSIGTVIAFVTEQAQNIRTGTSGEPLPSLNRRGELLPKVRFVSEWGGTRDMVLGREEWTLEMPDGEFLGGRIQIPLCLAWALSIHKSQGQTLPKVRVDLGRVFEKGQAYVALSRATTLEGLQVLNFDPHKVMVHPKVVEFYDHVEKEKERLRGDRSIHAL